MRGRRSWAAWGQGVCLAAIVACDSTGPRVGDAVPVPSPSFAAREGALWATGDAHVASVRGDVLWIAPLGRGPDGEGLELRTTHIGRDGLPRARLAPSAAEADGGGSLRIARAPGCTEELENRHDGVEQRWRFDRAPRGHGDLIVEVGAGDGSFVATTPGGLRLVDPSGFAFQYGHATWIDATGAATHVPARWTHGTIAIRVPARVVDGSVYPAVLDPLIGPETEVDSPVLSASAAAEREASAAFDGTTHLIVWIDDRAGGPALYAARVSAGGAVLDDYGIRIDDTASGPAAVAAGASGWLVVWSPAGLTARGLDVVRVAPDGTLLGAPTTVLAPSSSIPYEVEIASDGTGYLVTYTASSRLYGLRLLSDGTAPAAPFVVSSSYAQEHDLTWNGTHYLAVWDDGSNVRGARVAPDGSLVDTTPLSIATDSWEERDPAVASGGTGTLVVWQDARDLVFAGIDIWGAHVDASGAVGAAFVVGGGTRDQQMPAVAFDDSNYHVAWEDGRDPLDPTIYGGRVTPAGAILDGTGFRIDDTAPDDTLPLLSSGAGAVLASWEVESNLVARAVTSAGAPAGPSEYVATAAGGHYWPRIVEGSAGYLAMWTDYRAWPEYGDIYAARLDSDGNPIGGSFAVGAQLGTDEAGGVGFDGAHYLVTWGRDVGTHYDIYGSRIDAATGAVLDPGGTPLVALAADQYGPAVSHDGTSWLVAWMDHRAVSPSSRWGDVYAARFDASLVSMDGTGFPISSVHRSEWPVDAAAVPGTHFVTWKLYVPFSATVEARGARIVGGTVLDPEGRALGGIEPLGVDADGTGFMTLSGARSGMLVASRIDASGSIATYGLLSLPDLYAADLAWDGTSWLALVHEASPTLNRVRGLRFTSAGTLVDSAPFDVLPMLERYFTPRVASAGGARSVVAYTRWTPDAPYDSFRVWTRAIGGDPLADGAACASPSACASGHCVAGICCATACEDGLACNGAETCPGGTCTPGAPPSCDDGDPCTTDACSESSGCTSAPITGCGDAGPADAGPPDAGPPDAGPPDAGPPDAAPPDAGPPDAGPPDAGPPDAGPPDAGRPDAGSPDAGFDAGAPPRTRDAGCGCAVPAYRGEHGSAGLLLVAWWIGRRASRKRRAVR